MGTREFLLFSFCINEKQGHPLRVTEVMAQASRDDLVLFSGCLFFQLQYVLFISY